MDGSSHDHLISELSAARGGTWVISYVTSTRPFLEVPMAMDVVPVFYEHLASIPTPPEETRIDLLIHSNGGEGIVPWRLITLLREYCRHLTVLIPNRAFSAATLTALGADEVLMHPMGMLGPTDPTVTSEFNPTNPRQPDRVLGISVEDVISYISLVKEDFGISDDDELIEAFRALAQNIHPLALGNVKRSHWQSRLLGESLLRLRNEGDIGDEGIADVIDRLTSQLYYHGHPINRREAREALGLRFVRDAEPDVERTMWDLYSAYARQMRLDQEFRPLQEAWEISGGLPVPPPAQGTAVRTVQLGWRPLVVVESAARSDVLEVEFEVTLRRQWSGELDFYLLEPRSRWATPSS